MRADWNERAACSGLPTDMFFAEGAGSDETTQFAKDVCNNDCPVIVECLQFALKNNEIGVWGGLTDKERSRLNRHSLRVVPGMDTHGTESSYQRHLRLNTVPCAECRRAHARCNADKRRRRVVPVG